MPLQCNFSTDHGVSLSNPDCYYRVYSFPHLLAFLQVPRTACAQLQVNFAYEPRHIHIV